MSNLDATHPLVLVSQDVLLKLALRVHELMELFTAAGGKATAKIIFQVYYASIACNISI